MTAIEKLIEEKKAESPEFARVYEEERERSSIAVALMLMRKAEGLSQKQLAEKSGKPQSTIARIENGTLNVSVGVLRDIAKSVNRTVEISFPQAF